MDELEASKALAEVQPPRIPVLIATSTEFVSAGETLRQIKGESVRLKALRDDTLAPFREGMQRVQRLFAPKMQMLDNAEADLKEAIAGFTESQELERRRQEAALRDTHAEEQRRAEARAARFEERGKDEQAEAIRDAVRPVPTVIMDTPKVSGVTTRDIWSAEVVDFMALVAAVAKGEVPAGYLMANSATLNAAARAMKGAGRIPGVAITKRIGVAASAS